MFTDIPYTIIITTLSAPLKRKDNAPPERDLFPFAPRAPSGLDFELHRFVDMPTAYEPSNPEERVVEILSKTAPQAPHVEVDVGPYEWIADQGKLDRGRWMHEVTFHSAMNLRFTPTFSTDDIKIKVCIHISESYLQTFAEACSPR